MRASNGDTLKSKFGTALAAADEMKAHTRTRLVAVCLAVVITAACGGGVGSNSGSEENSGDGDVVGDGDGDGDDTSEGDTSEGDTSEGEPHCTTHEDCDAANYERCLAPGETFHFTCGAIDWCGQCTCGPQPILPDGSGTVCSTETDCPESTAQLDGRVASVCDDDLGSCQECAEDSDCSEERPYCALEEWSGTRQCFECKTEDDCSGESPVCNLIAPVGGTARAGSCVECVTTADCSEGICQSDNVCYDQCQTDEDCASFEFTACQDKRCAPTSCSRDADCPSNAECTTLGCQRKQCTADDDCDAGAFCVNTRCYDQEGTCEEELAVPSGG